MLLSEGIHNHASTGKLNRLAFSSWGSMSIGNALFWVQVYVLASALTITLCFHSKVGIRSK